jgi:hypothetical protein
MQTAGQAVPAMGQWIAPTLSPEEIDKRISELKTVQFWLEQNARMISTTIQALEVQRMTLSTLQTMNLPMADLRTALTLPTAAPARSATKSHAPAISPPPAEKATRAPAAAAAPAVDPMQWWGALTRQFTELAAGALRDSTAAAAKVAAAADAAPAAAPEAGKAAAKEPRRRAPAARRAAR